MHCTWFGCSRSCMEDPSYRFLANGWLFHNWFINLGNPLEAIVHHLLIGGMIGLGYWNGFPMVSALVCIVTHWIGSMVSHDLRLSSSLDLTKLPHCVISQSWENIKLVLKLAVVLTYKWDRKLIIYSLWIGPLLLETGSNRYSQWRRHDISWDWDNVSPWVIKRRCFHINYGHDSSLSGTRHRLFES